MRKGKKPKKPISKKTAALLQQLERRRGVRELAKRFLIVCEDGKTAPNYFEALKKHFNLSAASIRVAGSGGRTQPIQVVERAIELSQGARNAGSGTEPFDQVWCVIDGDYGDKIAIARSKADAHGVHLAISTMCFEYWLLLHFEENDKSTSDCDGLVHRLRRKGRIPNYKKGDCEFAAIVGRVHDATRRAKRLRQAGLQRGDLPERQNPCSEVYKLIDAILQAST